MWADHASATVTVVRVDGQVSSAWQWRNAQDVTGHPVTLIEFSQPVTGDVEAEGIGKADATSGNQLTNPAAIIRDLMTTIAGRDAPNVAWVGYEAARLGIQCAGELAAAVSLQSAIGALCGSIGALYSSRGRQFARVYPGGRYEGGGADPADESGPLVNVTLIDTAECKASGICNAVMIQFAYRGGSASRTIEVDAPDSIARFGRRVTTINAEWVGDARVAYDVAARLLTWRSEPSWWFKANNVPGDIRTLEVIHLSGTSKLPVPAHAVVLVAGYDPMRRSSAIEFESLTAHAGALRFVRQSFAIEADQLAVATVQTVGDQRIVKLKKPTGEPFVNAPVLLDGSLSLRTDNGGFVRLPVHATPPGEHTLAITDGATVVTITLLTT